MPDLTLYRDDIKALAELCDIFADLFATTPYRAQQSKALHLSSLLHDRLSQDLHPQRPASCDVCGELRPLYPANYYAIETYACAECIGLDPEDL